MVRTAAAALILIFSTAVLPAHDGLAEQIAAVTSLLRQDPGNAALYLKRGELHRARRDFRRALADYDEAGRLDPSARAIEFARARTLLDMGEAAKADAAASRFLTADPDHGAARVVRARARVQLGSPLAAAGDYDRAIAHQPSPELYLERARALVAAGDRHVPRALEGLDEAARRIGPVASLELYALDLNQRLGQHDAALARLDRLAAQAQRQELWLARRGAVLERAGRPIDARDAYARALQAAEAHPAARRPRNLSALIEELRGHLDRLTGSTDD